VRRNVVRRVKERKNSGDVIAGKPANFTRRKTKAIPGDWLIQCDVTGQVCRRSEASLTWRGLLVSNQNWDVKHPQLTIRVPPEDISISDARPFKGVDGGGLSVADYQENPSGGWPDGGLTTAQSVNLSDQTILFTDDFPAYQLDSSGRATAGDAGIIDRQWWTLSPLPQATVGKFHQVQATFVSNTGVEISGPFGSFVNLDVTRIWNIVGGDGIAVVQIQIRQIFGRKVVQDVANITFDSSIVSTIGWDPDLEFQTSGATGVLTYSDDNKIGTLTILNSGEGGELSITSAIIQSSGQRYVEFKILNAGGLTSLEGPRFSVIEAGLMPSRQIVGAGGGGFVNGTQAFFNNKRGNVPVFNVAFENGTESSFEPSSSTLINNAGDVVAFAIDFDSLITTLFINNVEIGALGGGFTGDAYGPLQPNFFGTTVSRNWQIRIQETAADQDFTAPIGFTPWAD